MGRKKLTAKQVLEAVPLDLTLYSPAFVKAWKRWIENRLALGRPVTIGAFQIHMAKCAVMGERRAIQAIENSIENSYQSIFESNHEKKRNSKPEPSL
jgi:hypothetical protein